MVCIQGPWLLIFVTYFSVIPVSILGGNILFLMGGGNMSHKMNFWPLVTALADKGHNVTVVSSFDKKPTEHSGVTDISPKAYQALTSKMYDVDRLKKRLDGDQTDLTSESYDRACIAFCEQTLNSADDPVLTNLIENGKFDLVLINFVFNDCGYLLAHHFGAKSIMLSSALLIPCFHGMYGIPMEISWIPDILADVNYPMGLKDRMWNMYRYLKGYSRREAFGRKMEELYKKRFKLDSVPSFSDLERNVSLVFLNSHHSVDFARSLPPMIVNIGGMQCWSPLKELPKNFQEFMDGADRGVILITFGSTILLSSLPEAYINIFFETMKLFDKVRFIWRWDGPMPANHPPNLMASNWLPQREILNHPKTIAFMTHGGFNGLMEATFYGIPLIAFPLFLDQNYNAYKVQAHEIGVAVEFRDFSQKLLDEAVSQIVYNPKYKKNMETRSRIFKDRSQNPIDEAVYWSEFVLRQDDTSALKPMLLDQPWYIRTSFDVFLVFTLLILCFPIFLLLLIIKCVKYLY